MSNPHPILHTSDLQWSEQTHGKSYHLRRKALSQLAGTAPGGSKDQRTLTQFFQNYDQTDYWQGEE